MQMKTYKRLLTVASMVTALSFSLGAQAGFSLKSIGDAAKEQVKATANQTTTQLQNQRIYNLT